jgi:phosphoribosylformylglycinamidine synthase
MAESIRSSQIIMIPGGFSAGDEPEGSAKFIMAVFRNPYVSNAIADLMDNRDGLILGICNGFQALIKLGLVPYGMIKESSEDAPTLTYNTIGRHVSRLVRTRVSSVLSPWLAGAEVGDVYTMPVSHSEGRFVVSDKALSSLIRKGQIATQYADADGAPSMDIGVNPNGSRLAIEGITSPDGRVFGKMGHVERIGKGLYKNVPGNYENGIFRNGVNYFK